MAEHEPLAGFKYYIEMESDTPNDFKFLCGILDISDNISGDFEEVSVNSDCDTPGAKLITRRAPRGTSREFSVAGSYSSNDKRIKDAVTAQTLHQIRLYENLPLADGGGYEQMYVYFSSHQASSQKRGTVNFSATILVDGNWTWVDAAPP